MDIKDKLNTTIPEVVSFVEDQYRRRVSSYGKPAFPTWRKREEVRLATNFYSTSDVILKVEELTRFNHALHISRTDPNMVAYTPSVEAGDEDKQLTTTLGKFLRKHLLLVTDNWISDQVAEHMAEIHGAFECARTPAEIRWAYTSMPSDGSCMRYQPSNWYNGTLDVHPSEVYATDHTYVAYIPGEPDDDGKPTVKARALVYEKGDDKRYVRVYGAPVLEKILIRKGYKCMSLVGARLRRIPIPDQHNSYVMPYLDGPGGAQSDPHSFVVDDGEALIVMHREKAVPQGEGFYAQAKNHGGAKVTLLKMMDPTWVSAMTGIAYNTLVDGRPLYYITPIGTVGMASVDELDARRGHNSGMKRAMTRHDKSNVYVWTYGSAPTFYHQGTHWLDNEANRLHLGYRRVASKYDILPIGTWVSYLTNPIDHTGKEIQVSGETPLVTIVGSDGVLRGMVAACLPLLAERKDYRKCGRYNERDVYAHKSCEKLTRSEGGTWFVQGVHEGYGQCEVSGKWYATKALMSCTVWGRQVLIARDAAFSKELLLAKNISVLEWKALADAEGLSVVTLNALLRSAETRAAALVAYETGIKLLDVGSDGSLFRDYYTRGLTFSALNAALTRVNARCATGIWGESDRQQVYIFNNIVEMVRVHFEPYAATLKATIERLEAEAAGQLVIEEGVIA